ncbi:Pkinase-domain-containing protein [Guyanagaster necrorhizus]|uniref:Pkinase-domain-containing protein n=1 Tax=Guyanagaster necrorhizus TaxID=856835 RepID=A0A9P7VW06_9AGAR|nr:Pkinase-domain-containing protein [Guyanagaster necrorhizus MCA 3950]KAG7447194.1 Pkinase-domain-containing protein [Guyanagaster necrorhizus MCA 3950]
MAPSSSLKIPTMDTAAGPSRQQYPAGSSRPVSVTVQSSASSAAGSSAVRKQRASHSVVSPSAQSHQSSSSSHHLNGGHAQDDGQPPYTDVYSHPAAMAYASSHPRRTIPRFGPYLLLQTLGEGEFGKVKLGLHSQWGEEVAVKLIRRGNVDTSVRMSKVEREIEVLRTLKHPNIVRLYDVIETDKYIGIIIEYASGGELFDHILAHRYLRERDAAKLFSQLISGVWYIHQKKIVHRDLKLENLLLDRHRNVIITDFGFANRFEHRSDDLMQTSCGSPCYAAPELVISEGLYVGSAVDIWSCGVILYAMLAGYLPFDDDPANPDGDNINLLYKYIVNTPLSFPDYVSQEARGLLSLMLVPDPAYRASLDQVMAHPWLAAYNSPPTDPSLFVPRAFGRTVEELERAAMEQHHQKRLAYQRQMKAAAVASGSGSPDRIGRSHSHRPTGYETGGTSASAKQPSRSHSIQPGLVYETSVDQGAGNSGPSSPPISAPVLGNGGHYEDMDSEDPFAAPSGVASPEVTNGKPGGRKSAARPHTVQVEYDGPRDRPARKERGRESQEESTRERDRERKQRERSTSRGQTQLQPSSSSGQSSERRRPPQSSGVKPLPPSPPGPTAVAPRRERAGSRTAPVHTHAEPEPPNITLASPPDTPLAFASPEGDADDRDEESSSRGSGKHKRGMSTVGGLSKIFSNDHNANGASVSNVSNTSGSLLTSAPSDKEKDNVSHVTADKKSRRSSLTVIISRTIKSRKGKMAATPISAVDDARNEKNVVLTSQVPPANAPMSTKEFSEVTSRATNDVYDTPGPGRDSGMQASTSKARKVMHWFRSRSKGRDPVGLEEEEEEKPAATDHVPKNESRKRSSNAVNQTLSSPRAASVQVTLTAPSRTPSGHQAPMHPQRTPSSATDASLMTPSFVTRIRNSVTVGGGSGGGGSHSKNVAGVLRIHHGAVDQDMVTTRSPPEVIKHMKEVLIGMGIEVQVESEYKYRCIRAKRRKVPGASNVIANVGAGPSSGGLAAVTMMGSAASNGVDKRGLPVPSHASFSGGMLRGLLMRRQSSHVSQPGNMAVSFEEEPSVMVLETGAVLDPVYGDSTEDVGDEVRFSVELTRMDRLNDTYSLDIRRLKGNLRSYKFLYDTVRQRADLQR